MPEEYILSRRERKKRDCKYAILRAARDLMTQHGPEVSVEEIAKAAGISYPTFFNYFPAKAALYYAIYQEETEDLREFINIELSDTVSAAERVTRIFQNLMQDFQRYRYLDLYIAGDVARHTAATGSEEPICALLTETIEAGCTQGEFRTDLNARHYALLLTGIVFSTSFYGCGESEYLAMLRILLSGMQS